MLKLGKAGFFHNCVISLLSVGLWSLTSVGCAQEGKQTIASTNDQLAVDRIVSELRHRAHDLKSTEILNLVTPEVKLDASTIAPLHLLRSMAAVRDIGLGAPELQTVPTQSLVNELRAHERAIYGPDNRIDWYALDPRIRPLAESVAALISSTNILQNTNGTSTLLARPFGICYLQCERESFYDQPIAAFGTGFLIRSNLLCTAGHCVEGDHIPRLKDIRIVFGFRMGSQNGCITNIPNSDIYIPISVLRRSLDQGKSDFAVLELDRPVSNRAPLKMRSSGTPDNHASVYVLGHPCGLPLKFAANAFIRDNSQNHYFKANLDAFGGNSGSPVFSDEGVVEGILVRGETDFVRTDTNCWTALVYPSSGPDGEECNRITDVVNALAQH